MFKNLRLVIVFDMFLNSSFQMSTSFESKIRFFDSVRFMAISMSRLIDNLSEALRAGK